MSEIECPKCGRLGNVPKDKLTSRLVCKKCLAVFHLTPTGRAVVGEPPDHKYEERAHAAAVAAEKKHQAVDVLADLDVGRNKVMTAILAAIVLGFIGVYMFSGETPNDFLQFKATTVAEKLADEDFKFVMQNTAKDGSDDAKQWIANVQSILSEMKKESARQKLDTLVMVIEENKDAKVGQVEVAYRQVKGTTHEEEIAKAANAKPTGRTSLIVPIFWVFEGGRWKIDGPKTLTAYASIH